MSHQQITGSRRARALVPALLGLLLGALVLGPALGRGYVLVYDMVFLPDPPPTRAMFGLAGGFPRQVPSDAVAAALATVLPGDLAQKLILLFIFGFGAWGAARLLPCHRLLPRAAAALCYVWNPFIAQRLLLGQWALLLGYAGLPWALAAAVQLRRPGGAARLTRSLIPATIGGFAALGVCALVVLGGVLTRPPEGVTGLARRVRGLPAAMAVMGGLAMPWLVPALLAGGQGRTDPGGVDLFAPRADTPFGTVGSLLSLGGIWNAETVPAGYSAWPAAAGRLILVVAALWSAGRALDRPQVRGLAGAAAAGLVPAGLGITAPGRAVTRRLVGLWPGFGVLRDGQVYLAPLALLVAVGFGLLVAALLRGRHDWAALAAIVLVAPVALLPGLGWGAGGRLVAVSYPADWARMRSIVDGDAVPGLVLALPWGAYRRFGWNGGRTVLDPLPRAVRRQVVQDDGLQVGDHVLHAEAPLARRADALLRRPGPLTATLAAEGYRYVVVEKVNRAETTELRARLAGSEPVLDGPDLAVHRLPQTRPPTAHEAFPHNALAVSADVAALTLVLWAIAAPTRRSGQQGGSPRCGS
jgi:hypothetical protein